MGVERNCWTLAFGTDLPGFSLSIPAVALFPWAVAAGRSKKCSCLCLHRQWNEEIALKVASMWQNECLWDRSWECFSAQPCRAVTGLLCAGGAPLSPLSPRGAAGYHETGHCVLWGEPARAVPPCHEVWQKWSGSPHCHWVFTQSKTSSIDPK